MVFSNNLLMGAAGQSTGYEIDQSIRFDNVNGVNAGGAQMYRLALTGTPTNDKKATISAWVKRATLGYYQVIAYSGDPNGSTSETFRFNTDNTLTFSQASSVYNLTTTQVFRDVGAWYHMVAEIDTANGTSADRANLYVNGEKITSFSTATYPSLNYVTNWTASSASIAHTWGTNGIPSAGPSSQLFAGYMAEMYVLDGEKAGPTAFGEFNDSGVWIPTAYSGAFGNNGYYMTGETASALGEDFSGNGLDFTTVALATTDQMLDTPTLNYCTMNILDNGRPANITVSDGNLTCAFAGAGYNGGIRSSFFFDSEDSDGWYAECTLDSLALASVFRAGVANASLNLASNDAQTSADGWAYSDQGAKLNNSYTTGYGSAVTPTDIVGIAVRNGKIYFAINNTWQGSANPVTEANAAFTNLTGDVAFCQSTNTGGSYAHTATWNFGQSDFAYTPPTGFKALNTANLPTPSITDGSAHMQTLAYASTGTSTAFVQDGNSQFEPGLVWEKSRTGANNHLWFDQVRGATKFIRSDTTNVENTVADTLTSFNSNGFTAGADSVNWGINYPGRNNVAWMWKANGAGSSNEDGSINTTATSVNTTAGFSVSTFTGTGANATVGHGLGIAPSFVIIKSRNDTHDWYVWTPALATTEFLKLNSTAAKGTSSPEVWNSTAPTSSVVSLGTSIGVNRNTYNYVMYCFAEIPNYSSFGSYTGNGSTDGPFVYTNGMKPAFVMTKRTSAAGDWKMWDNERGPYNVNGLTLAANSSGTESSGVAQHSDFLSNGFKIRGNDTETNGSGSTYIYVAFAENPFGGDGAAPATAR